jgi:hypothetical protein
MVGAEMTKHIAPLPDPDGSLLLRELNHRVNNELNSTICTISAKAVKSDDVAVKAALLDVVDLLHGYADVHKALRMPDTGHLTDAARYLQHLCFSITKYRLDRLSIRLLYSADDFRLEGERCWKLGLIVGNVVRCAVSDNGSASDLIVRGRGLTIVGELAGSLGGRVHASCAAQGSSFLLTFPLTESEQHAAFASEARCVIACRKCSIRPPHGPAGG